MSQSAPPQRQRPRSRMTRLVGTLGAHQSLEAALISADRLLERANSLDFACFEGIGAQQAVPHLLSGPVFETLRILTESQRFLRSLPRLIKDPTSSFEEPASAQGPPPEDRATLADATEGLARPVHDRFAEELDQAILKPLPVALKGDEAAKALALQQLTAPMVETLGLALEVLRQARQERAKWSLITAGEQGRHKVQRSLRAAMIVTTRMMALGHAHEIFADERSELESALMVRELLMQMRADLLVLSQQSQDVGDEELGLHLREVRVRMREFMGAHAYREMRAPDRFSFNQLLGTIGALLETQVRDVGRARQALVDLAAFADGLAAINQRSILRDYDKRMGEKAIAVMQVLDRQLAAMDQNAKVPSVRHAPDEKVSSLSQVAALLHSARWHSDALLQALGQEREASANSTAHEMRGRLGALASIVIRELQ